jgi:hypothetical protein
MSSAALTTSGRPASTEAGSRFDYSDRQWQAIQSAVREGCLKPSDFRRELLLKDANTYLVNMPRHKPLSKRMEVWQRKAHIVDQFYRLAGEIGTEREWPSAPEERPADMWRFIIGNDEYSKFLETVGRCKQILAMEADHCQGSVHGPNHPRVAFLRSILETWLDAAGGLRASHGSRRDCMGAPDGPLVRYVRAVTVPVMGRAAPDLEAIYKLIRRTKKSLGKIFVFDTAGRFMQLEDGGLVTVP